MKPGSEKRINVTQDFHLLVKGFSFFSDQTKFIIFGSLPDMLKQNHFHRRWGWRGSEQIVPMLREKKLPDTAHEPLIIGLVQFPLSQLELHLPLSSSVWNPTATTLYQRESQPVCTHMDTIMPFSTDPTSTP